MKLKSLVLVTLFVAACSFASAQSYSFGFLSAGGGLEYCNYEQINNNEGFAGLWQGEDNLSVCQAGGISANSAAPIIGFTDTLTAADEIGIVGKGVVYGDGLYDALAGGYTGDQWTVYTQLKAAKKITSKTKYSWIGVAGTSAGYFGDNYGFLTTTLPDASKGASAGTTAGKSMLKKDFEKK